MDQNLRKKIYIIAGALAGLIVLILLIIFIASIFTSGKRTYQEVEEIMEKAAIEYYKDNNQLLPTTEDKELRVDVSTLVTAEKMTSLSTLLNDESCTGSVVVKKSQDIYTYTPYLECTDKYKTESLAQKLTQESNIVSSGDGLYFLNNEYVYRGEVKDNYIQLEGKTFRIVKVTAENKLMLLLHDTGSDEYRYNWDNRYNSERSANTGINDYNISRMNDYLQELYNDEEFLSDKSLLTTGNFCIGKRGETDSVNNGTIECSALAINNNIGLLTVSDYLNASLDTGCVDSTSRECQNYNYLAYTPNDWWLATANNANTYQVYILDDDGEFDVVNASVTKVVRPVIYLSPSAMYASGTGTYSDPYIVR